MNTYKENTGSIFFNLDTGAAPEHTKLLLQISRNDEHAKFSYIAIGYYRDGEYSLDYNGIKLIRDYVIGWVVADQVLKTMVGIIHDPNR